jgi:hypothetical protein
MLVVMSSNKQGTNPTVKVAYHLSVRKNVIPGRCRHNLSYTLPAKLAVYGRMRYGKIAFIMHQNFSA